MKTDIIKKLVELYTEGTHPNVATTVSQSLNQLSSGIYTEEERFIFELLQNAVDAFSGENTLSVKIAIKGNYLVFFTSYKMMEDVLTVSKKLQEWNITE